MRTASNGKPMPDVPYGNPMRVTEREVSGGTPPFNPKEMPIGAQPSRNNSAGVPWQVMPDMVDD